MSSQIFLRLLILHHLTEDELPNIPRPPVWTHTLIIVFASLQLGIAMLILWAYAFNKNFRVHPGNISVGFAFSALGLSTVWLLNFDGNLTENHTTCAWLGFFAQLTEYSSAFYELGTLYYFLCYFREIAKPSHLERNPGEEPGIPEEAFIDFKQNTQETEKRKSMREEHVQILPLPYENLSEDPEKREIQQRYNKMIAFLTQQELIIKELTKKVEKLSKSHDQSLLHLGTSSFAALKVQTRIHICVILASFAVVLIPSLTEVLGPDFSGVCAIEWEPNKQTTGITITILVTVFSAVFSLLILAYFCTKHETRKQMKGKITERESHYAKHLLAYVFCSTIFGFGLATTNIFADYQVDYTSRWIEEFFVVHYLMIAVRGILLLWLKLLEPETRKAISESLCQRKKKEQNKVSDSNASDFDCPKQNKVPCLDASDFSYHKINDEY